jgi:hypothetical protein
VNGTMDCVGSFSERTDVYFLLKRWAMEQYYCSLDKDIGLSFENALLDLSRDP